MSAPATSHTQRWSGPSDRLSAGSEPTAPSAAPSSAYTPSLPPWYATCHAATAAPRPFVRARPAAPASTLIEATSGPHMPTQCPRPPARPARKTPQSVAVVQAP
jgi:hypothetical protein